MVTAVPREAARYGVAGGVSVFDGWGRLVESVYSERAAVEADKNAIAYESESISMESKV